MAKQRPTNGAQEEVIQPAPNGAERRRQLTMVAYQLIAEKGFEGLRTREVAEKVGLNHATLHYHFPTKEDLIRGVVEYLIQQFRAPHTSEYHAEYSPKELLRAEFHQINHLAETPDMVIVISELSLRALRDPPIAQLLNEMDEGWHNYLCSILRSGVQQGVFRTDIDIDLSAQVIMTMIKGIRSESLEKSPQEIERISTAILKQLERWLTG